MIFLTDENTSNEIRSDLRPESYKNILEKWQATEQESEDSNQVMPINLENDIVVA